VLIERLRRVLVRLDLQLPPEAPDDAPSCTACCLSVRDTLLPKLLSGGLRAKDSKRFAEAAI